MLDAFEEVRNDQEGLGSSQEDNPMMEAPGAETGKATGLLDMAPGVEEDDDKDQTDDHEVQLDEKPAKVQNNGI